MSPSDLAFFFFKQKTAYEMPKLLEFRRVLFRSGKALKFYASVRLDIRRKDTLKDDAGNAIGNHVRVKVVKNKVAPPFAEAEFDIIYNHGINKEGCILEVGIEHGVVDKKGAWLQFEGELIGQGKEVAQKAMVEKDRKSTR